jgi:hypothetical protein
MEFLSVAEIVYALSNSLFSDYPTIWRNTELPINSVVERR